VVTVASYGVVEYQGLYPGVDLRLNVDPGELRLRFRVDRGGSAAPIRLSIDGARATRDDTGVTLGPSALRIDDTEVRAYEVNGDYRRPVPVALTLHEEHILGVNLGAHDVRRQVDIILTVRARTPPAASPREAPQTLAMAQ
jgi:hypothetical protein